MSDEYLNPPRGCGRKREGGFYLESGPGSENGSLRKVTHVLAGAGSNYEIPAWVHPSPRSAIPFNPIQSLVSCELRWPQDKASFEGEAVDLFTSLFRRVPSAGIIDHVGKAQYSAESFRKELQEYGASRRVTKQFAKATSEFIAERGACPVFFTHSRIPVLDTAEKVDECMEVVAGCIGEVAYNMDAYWWEPTWFHEDFSLYATKDTPGYGGHNSWLFPVLSVVDQLDRNWKRRKENPAYKAAKKFFGSVTFVEQPFCASWFTQVTYTLPKDGKVSEDIASMKGIRYVDLSANGGDGAIVGYSLGGLE